MKANYIVFKDGRPWFQWANGYTPDELLAYAKRFAEINGCDPDTVIVGKEAMAYSWQHDYDRLSELDKWLIDTVLTELPGSDLHIRRDCIQLVRIAQNRVAKAGFNKTCTRCGGSGHFSWNAIHGSKCYGCGGSGIILPKFTNKLKKGNRESL